MRFRNSVCIRIRSGETRARFPKGRVRPGEIILEILVRTIISRADFR